MDRHGLGGRILDPDGIEGAATGLGLLPIVTTYDPDRIATRTTARFGVLPAEWSWLDGCAVTGYEIRHGHSEANGTNQACTLPGALAYAVGNVMGITSTGSSNAQVLKAFSGSEPQALDSVFDELADAIDAHIDDRWLARQVG